MVSWWMAADHEGRHTGSWSIIQGSTNNNRIDGKHSWEDAALGTCCTRCILYSVYAVLGVYSTHCPLMIMTWREREGWLNFLVCNDGRVVDENQGDGGWRWELCGGYKQKCEIMGTTCLVLLGKPCIAVISCQIGTGICNISDGKLTRTQDSLESPFLILISSMSSDFSLSHHQHYHQLKT